MTSNGFCYADPPAESRSDRTTMPPAWRRRLLLRRCLAIAGAIGSATFGGSVIDPGNSASSVTGSRLGCFNFHSALASIWRMRSRVETRAAIRRARRGRCCECWRTYLACLPVN